MRSERLGSALATVAALLAGTPAPAARPEVIWVEICDAVHPGRRIPLPLHREREGPQTACHATCAVMPERRARR